MSVHVLSKLLFLSAVFLLPLPASGSPVAKQLESGFDAVLRTAVVDGWVDYALRAEPGPLDDWLGEIEAVSWIDVRKWSRDHVVAFFINAYNGHVLRIVRDRYPIEGEDPQFPTSSIQQIPDVWALPIRVAQQELTLDSIEKRILTGELGAFRAHFALVCASVGCPQLWVEAYRGDGLLQSLNLAAQIFIRSPHGALVDQEKRVLRLSQLFDWYHRDFLGVMGTAKEIREIFGEYGPMIEFVSGFLREGDRRFVRMADFKLEYFDYDWTLNDVKNRPR